MVIGTLLAGRHRVGILMMKMMVLTKAVVDGRLKMKKRAGEVLMATCYTRRACNMGRGVESAGGGGGGGMGLGFAQLALFVVG